MSDGFGPVISHLSIGQETIAVGVATAMKPNDWTSITPSRRA
jgi:TPP-dependent pyruvate/acetoin dehydrogenase alpha subunit